MCGTKIPLIPAPSILCFRGCATLQFKRNVFEGTVHRVFRSTSTWENFDRPLKKNQKGWLDNQYPKNWSDKILFETLNKIIEGKFFLEVTASEPKNDKWLKDYPPFYIAISRQSISTDSCKGLANIRGTNNFHNMKNENMLAIPQKILFARELSSRVVYRLTWLYRGSF